MTTKRSRTHNPAWPDSPAARTARSNKRRQRLNELAREHGFMTWDRLATAALNGELAMSEWVAVKDKEPESKANVIVALRDRRVLCGYLYKSSDGHSDWRLTGGTYGYEAVTHWMPYPKPPEVVFVTVKDVTGQEV